MKRLTVHSIVVPAEEELSLNRSVDAADRITEAIEVMLKNDLKQIAVTERGSVVGMIKLEDALKKLGLEEDVKARGKKTVVFQGRRFDVEK